MTDIASHYEGIAEASRKVRKQAFSELAPIQAAHLSLDVVRTWQAALVDRPEAVVFAQVVSGLELGLFALVSGLYRQAYGSLRLAVELIAGLSWFSSHRLDLAEWQVGEKDLVWREITNPEEGILSPRYKKAFFPDLDEVKKYNGLYSKLYRELSEHVHGNALTWAAGPDDIAFDKDLHDQWLNKLETFMLVMNVILSLRYLQEVAKNHLAALDPILRSRIPQVGAIMKFLDDRLPQPALAASLEETSGVVNSSAVVPDPAPTKPIAMPTTGEVLSSPVQANEWLSETGEQK